MMDITNDKFSDMAISCLRIHGTDISPRNPKPNINHNQMMIDKSLVCKAFFDIDAAIVRICAPSGFGKTLNLKMIRTVFNIINCNDMPGSQVYHPTPNGSIKKLDLDVAQRERMKLVDSLLLRQEEEFFDKHFCRYPVLNIDFSVSMLAGVYNMPLYDDDNAVVTVAPALYMCYQRSSQSSLEAMFGITRLELKELCDILQTNEQEIDDASATFGGYSFAQNIEYFSAKQTVELYRRYSPKRPKSRLKGNSVSRPAKIVKSIICEASPELFMLLLRLISDYDSGTSSCFIWSTAELKAEHYKDANDLLFNLVIDPLANPSNTTAESSPDKIVTLLVYLGFLAIRANNVLCIPNNKMRDMWEDLRLLATFGSMLQTQQDFKQHRLISSLHIGQTDLLHAEFTSALQRISASSVSLSLQAQLEYACRWILSNLTVSRYSSTHGKANLESDQKFVAYPKLNTPWTVTLLPFGRYIQPLAVTLCFVQSPSLDGVINVDIAIGK
ncbi:hypothetical protein IWW36_001315 [Coemansia brasiliensis]|uniref:Uncharacterized protein n=1 Tax=Coemansia brasiliensis TaxID=2650707 RepID=A0A9W8M1N6_9FUNG|nr:hypothetical protein IWW36_001315 [Coemansia brasiliensis]